VTVGIALAAILAGWKLSVFGRRTDVDLLIGNWRGSEIAGYLAAKAQHFDWAHGINLHLRSGDRQTDPVHWLQYKTAFTPELLPPASPDSLQFKPSEDESGAASDYWFSIASAAEYLIARNSDPSLKLAGLISTRVSFAYVCGPTLSRVFPEHDSSFASLRLAANGLGRHLRIAVRPDPAGKQFYVYLVDGARLSDLGFDIFVEGDDISPYLHGEVDLWPADTVDEQAALQSVGGRVVPLPLDPASDGTSGDAAMYGAVLLADPLPPKSVDENLRYESIAEKVRETLREGWDWASKNPREAVEMLPNYSQASAGQRQTIMQAYFKTLAPGFDPRQGNQSWDEYLVHDKIWLAMKEHLRRLHLIVEPKPQKALEKLSN
jgi:hypothetical protein